MVAIMWKERIKAHYQHIRQQLQPWLETLQGEVLAEQVTLLTTTDTLPDGTTVEWRVSDPKLIPAMTQIEEVAYAGVLMWRAEDFYDDMIYNARAFYLQALVEQQLVAFVGVRRDTQDVHISNFVVAPAWQSHGLGGRILAQLQALLPQLKRTRLSLEVRESNVRAQRFYRRHGFSVAQVRPRYYTNNQETAYWMTYRAPKAPDAQAPSGLPPLTLLTIRKKNENDHNFSY